MAWAGQTAWQAVIRLADRGCGRSSLLRVDLGDADALHAVGAFLHDAAARTVTSGLRISFRLPVAKSANCKKLKRRTLYGQLFEQ